MMKKHYIYILNLLFILFSYTFSFAAGTLTIEAVGDGSLYEDYACTTPLQKGCLVQVILDRGGDGLNPIEYTGSLYPVDDDILLPVLSGSNTFRIGDGLPPFAEDGQFSINVTFDNGDPDPNYTGYKIYIRFWNSPNPGDSSFYGEAGPFVLEEGIKPQAINIINDGSLYTNKVLSH